MIAFQKHVIIFMKILLNYAKSYNMLKYNESIQRSMKRDFFFFLKIGL